MSVDTRPPALALRGIVKHFDGVPALRGASLDVARGTVHGLIGQNGAGKSTLIRILAGIDTADAGTIAIDGATQALAHRSPPEGIAFIHQERLLPATFTIDAGPSERTVTVPPAGQASMALTKRFSTTWLILAG